MPPVLCKHPPTVVTRSSLVGKYLQIEISPCHRRCSKPIPDYSINCLCKSIVNDNNDQRRHYLHYSRIPANAVAATAADLTQSVYNRLAKCCNYPADTPPHLSIILYRLLFEEDISWLSAAHHHHREARVRSMDDRWQQRERRRKQQSVSRVSAPECTRARSSRLFVLRYVTDLVKARTNKWLLFAMMFVYFCWMVANFHNI